MSKNIRIAIVEDDLDLMRSTEEYLLASGYSVWSVASAEAFYKNFSITPVDVVILDIGLPGENGLAVAEHLQKLPNLTVIITSAYCALPDRIQGLQAGADRYLVKPVDLSELAANIEAVCRRYEDQTPPAKPSLDKPDGQWSINSQEWMLSTPDGATLKLTAREFTLLKRLTQSQGETVNKHDLSGLIFGPRILTGAERVNVLLARLRKKVLMSTGLELPVKTVHQIGYSLTASVTLK